MRNWILILITGLLFNSCKGQDKVEFESHEPKHSAKELISILDSTYENQDSLRLIEFFNIWNLDLQPNNKKYTAQNERIESVYNIYRTFYIPSSPFNLGDWESFHIPENSLEYFVIQNKIFYSVLPDNDFEKFHWKTNKIDSINNFKPKLEHLGQNRILYLTPEYINSLNGFLGSKYKELGTDNIMSPSLPEGESEKRYSFLKKHIHILHGHWGGYWHLETHPDVSVIVINQDLTKAIIHFRYGYQGGETVLEKENGVWIIKSSKATWIE
ncbi:hypothetical protein [Lentimicrobium sp. S6]|uniref:hypothetical protein n=1 Tax=Lentimicrobium sp. S6 TaxID=2735872 RepID=UPI0015519A46|nr:hypothetical protein [Lentimicrobium sp. S6]NPD48188.1 hypothetical protein [Lentimicrobium sp. S6]